MKLQFSIFKYLNIRYLFQIKNFKLKIIAVSALVILQLQPGIVSAQELTSAPSPKPVEYTLPYPGLLPDHPLYFLRAIRDTVQNLLVSNPLKKAEFYLLQADKGISASSLLAEKHATLELAGATAFEAEGYFEKALDAVSDAKKQGLETTDISRRLVLANEKHIELLDGLENGDEKEKRQKFVDSLEKAKNLQKKAKEFLPDK